MIDKIVLLITMVNADTESQIDFISIVLIRKSVLFSHYHLQS